MTRQENFENNIILESELGFIDTEDGGRMAITISDLNYTKLCDIQLEKGRILDKEEKQLMNIFIWFKLKQLSNEERELAWKYYVEGKTQEQIANEMSCEIKSTNDERKGKHGTIKQPAIAKRLVKIKKKLAI